jgi:hypothetical protein
LRRLETGRDDNEITEALAEYWQHAAEMGEVWRFDVAHHPGSRDASYEAWQRGDRRLAAHYLLASFGLEHEGNYESERNEVSVVFLDELQRFAKNGGVSERIVAINSADRDNPRSGLTWRHELLWPLLYIPPERLWQVTPQECQALGIATPSHDINLFGNYLMTSLYDDKGQIAERLFYDPHDPEDQGALWAARRFQLTMRRLIQDGAGVELAAARLEDF